MSNEFLDQMLISAGIGAILTTIKNPNSEKAKRLKSDLLHLADSLYSAYEIVPPSRDIDGPQE